MIKKELGITDRVDFLTENEEISEGYVEDLVELTDFCSIETINHERVD